jgi:hypothetical protein
MPYCDKQIHKAKATEHVHALFDDWNDNTAFCLSLARVFPSMRTKPTPFSCTDSWIIQHKNCYCETYMNHSKTSTEYSGQL